MTYIHGGLTMLRGRKNGPEHVGRAAVTTIVPARRQPARHRARRGSASGLDVAVVPGPRPGTVSVLVGGEITHDSAPFLLQDLLAALVAHRAVLLVDLTWVTFCDCAGLNALLTARNAALSAGRALHVTGASRPVKRLLDLTETRPLLLCSRSATARRGSGPQ
ncbi:STAS domain-containing protein [Streptomyces sp. NPDC097619]|uniref:STAS domain-containing protein n=1 Tax=Streptomyces sp. NPDC097619 TaxID=3157228 RepID=UPI003332D8C1